MGEAGLGSALLSDKVKSLQLPKPAANEAINKLPWALAGGFALAALWLVLGTNVGKTTALTENIVPSTTASTALTPSVPNPTPEPRLMPSNAGSGGVVLEVKGYVIPAHQILVSPKVSGMIMELFVEEGRRVNKGEVLALVETTDYQAEFDRTTALLDAARAQLTELERGYRPEEIAQARAELAESEAMRDQWAAEYQRSIRLREANAVSSSAFEQVKSSYRTNEQRIERLRQALTLMEQGPRSERIDLARAQVRQNEAELKKAKWRLDNCTIRSPITGTILKKNAEEGNIVNPIAFNGSFSICDLADLADLEVDLSIQERDVSRIFKGQRCQVRAEAFPQRVYEGVVSRLMPIADRAKGAVPVRVKLTVPAQEEGVYLKPEMGAFVTFFKEN